MAENQDFSALALGQRAMEQQKLSAGQLAALGNACAMQLIEREVAGETVSSEEWVVIAAMQAPHIEEREAHAEEVITGIIKELKSLNGR